MNGAGNADVSNSMFQMASLPVNATGTNVLLNSNPLFVDGANNNFSIMPCSPAMNSGSNGFNSTSIDVMGNARFVGTIDRGAQEHTTGPPPTVVTSTGNSGAGTLRTIIADCCIGNTITFSNSLSGQTIQLTSPIVLNKSLNIHGLGINSLNVSGNGTHRIFTVNSNMTVTIRDLALLNGDSGSSPGNAIHTNGILTLKNVRLESEPNTTTGITLFSDSGSVKFQTQVIVK